MINKQTITLYIVDYIPTKLLDKITAKDIYDWRDFLYENSVFEIQNIYIYLDHKMKVYYET